ncbi:MAG TPA: HTH domain-containing protein [Polyangia bacterium]|nr:HTH domain-containing protein [Polyangia bacterium]
MTFLEAALEILRREGKPLHFKDLTERAMTKKLLTFVGRTPEVTMQTQLTAAVKKAPGSPFVRVKPGVFGLLRYPELGPEEREPEPKAPAAKAAASAKPDADDDAAEGGRGRRRRRRGGRGRTRGDEAPASEKPGAPRVPTHAAESSGEGGNDADDITEEHEPAVARMSAAARAAALAETGVLEGDEGGDDAADADTDADGDREDQARMGDDDETFPVAAGSAAGADADEGDEDDEDEAEGEGEGASANEGAFAAPPRPGEAPREGDDPLGRRRRRRRRRRRGDEGGAGAGFGGRPGGEGPGFEGGSGGGGFGAPAGASAGGGGVSPAEGEGRGAEGGVSRDAGAMDGGGPDAGDPQAPRRIMTPVDAAIEILRGQAPGRGVHVRQIADAAARRRLIHGEPNEAWRVMRTALAAESRERLRAGQRPRVRAAGSGLFALARRPPDGELERAEQVFGEARRALRERTLAALERRVAELPASAFEALARVLLQREGFGPTTFVKRVEGTIYVEALRGRGSRPSKCLIALRPGGSAAGRRSIGELRAGIRARSQDEGLLLMAGRLAEDGISEWKKAGSPLEIADGQAVAETCVRHGIGVINTMVSVDFVDADFFTELAEG